MVALTLATVFGLLAAASALPPTPPPADILQTPASADIEAIMAVPKDSFTNYKTGELHREGENATDAGIEKRVCSSLRYPIESTSNKLAVSIWYKLLGSLLH